MTVRVTFIFENKHVEVDLSKELGRDRVLVKDFLKLLGLTPLTAVAVRDGKLLVDEDVIMDGDSIEVYTVTSLG